MDSHKDLLVVSIYIFCPFGARLGLLPYTPTPSIPLPPPTVEAVVETIAPPVIELLTLPVPPYFEPVEDVAAS